MANRHLSRSIVVQSLYEWDFNNRKSERLPEIVARNTKEFGDKLAKEDKDFIATLTEGVVKKQPTLDSIVAKAAHDWPIAQTPIVDRNILRIGLYELLFAPKNEVPARVAINEAIELGKKFGGDRSGKFINGVLGTIYKEMGEPGKDDPVKKKKRKEDLTKEEKAALPVDEKAGAVVFHKDKKGNVDLAFVHDIFGYWTLSKGSLEEGETLEQGAKRKMKDEMNLKVEVVDSIGANEYVANDPERGHVLKRVTYVLAQADDKDGIKVGESGGLDDAKWFSLKEVEGLKIYQDVRHIIDKGINKIKKLDFVMPKS